MGLDAAERFNRAMNPSLLRVEHVAWSAGGNDVLVDVTFDVRGGEVVAIMGRNGAGKSTLLDIIAGLRRPRSGSVVLDNRRADSWGSRERARFVSHLPQVVRSDLPFVAHELVLMGRYPHTDRWFESDEDRRMVEEAMRRAHCWELRGRLVQTLSGGERQRVLLAACLAQASQVLLLDEPSTHLDIDQQLHCFSVLQEESRRGVACVAVTHDVNLALTFATRLIVIAGGRVAVDMPVEEATASGHWLSHFSDRLVLAATPGGRPWVAYS
ncbi:MAG: ABC transporter ATP-binding protein [Vicinamibacterales bacterium]